MLSDISFLPVFGLKKLYTRTGKLLKSASLFVILSGNYRLGNFGDYRVMLIVPVDFLGIIHDDGQYHE